jgi:hypothetical protein
MNPRRWVHRSAWISSLAAIACLAMPVEAQFAEVSSQAPELLSDPIARSARLLGMGRLTLLSDRDNRIHFWDFAANPVGLIDADTLSTLTLRPTTHSSSSSVDLSTPGGDLELQDAASRDHQLHFEAMRRPGTGTAFGVIGQVDQSRSDALHSYDSERRNQFSDPLAMPVVAGRLSFLNPERVRYAVFGVFGLSDSREEYRRLSDNGAGRYIDRTGTLMASPNYFVPDEYFVRRIGGGAALSYTAGPMLQGSLGGSIVSNGIVGTNEGDRYASENRERRPVFTGQGTLIGKIGDALEWGADGQMWTSSSQTTWVFTISPSGGPGPARPPLTGRGDLSKRTDEGNRVRLRTRWTSGAIEVGGSFGTFNRKVAVTPAPLSSPTSFNSFRILAYSQIAAADTIGFPEDVLSSRVDQNDLEAAGGIATRIGDRGVVGAEYHYVKRKLETRTGQGAVAEEILGLSPLTIEVEGALWDARAGFEYRCTDVLLGRAGYIFRNQDRDELTEMNEFSSHSVTAGFGLRPVGSRWAFDVGYDFEWGQADFGTPSRPRSTRQQVGLQMHWGF